MRKLLIVLPLVPLLVLLSACGGRVGLITTRDPGQITYVTVAIDKLAGPTCSPNAPAEVANEVRGIRAQGLYEIGQAFYGAEFPGEISELGKALEKFYAAIGRGVSKDTLEAWAAPAQLQALNLITRIIEVKHSYFFGAPSAISAVNALREKAIPLTTRLSEVKATVLEACETRGFPVPLEYFSDVEDQPTGPPAAPAAPGTST